jgi:hypothetical protein
MRGVGVFVDLATHRYLGSRRLDGREGLAGRPAGRTDGRGLLARIARDKSAPLSVFGEKREGGGEKRVLISGQQSRVATTTRVWRGKKLVSFYLSGWP